MPIVAADVMTSPPTVVAPTASLAEVARLLANKDISAVPVCLPDDTPVGIISEADIIAPFRESIRVRRDWWLGLLAEGEELPPEFLDYIRQDHRTVADVMVRNVIHVTEDAPLPQLAELMLKHAVRCLPVLRDGRVVGVVSRSDLLRAIAHAPAMTV
jgi:CBS domain-containing protein